jgi:hypothetical protein
MYKQGIGQAYCIYLLKRIPMKFVWYFMNFLQIYMNFENLDDFLGFK